MSGALSELHKAIKTAWTTAGLDGSFKAYWALADRSLHITLNDGEASPGIPFPYCVYEITSGSVTDRMSGDGTENKNYMVQDVPVTFKIFTSQYGTSSAKAVAVALAEKVIETFGGHPSATVRPIQLVMDDYGHLLTQYQTDFGMRLGDEEHLWTIQYIVRLDMPVIV